MLKDIPTPALREARSCVLETERLALRRPTLAGRKSDCASRQRSPHCGKHPPAAAPLFAGSRRRIRPRDGRGPPRDRVPDRTYAFADRHGRPRLARTGRAGTRLLARGRALGPWFRHRGRTRGDRFLLRGVRCRAPDLGRPRCQPVLAQTSWRNAGFQWSGVELHRFEALGSSTPVDRFRLTRSVWSSLKNWGSSTRRER